MQTLVADIAQELEKIYKEILMLQDDRWRLESAGAISTINERGFIEGLSLEKKRSLAIHVRAVHGNDAFQDLINVYPEHLSFLLEFDPALGVANGSLDSDED